MVSNVRDRNIDSSRREDSRKGQVDRCEIVNVRPHVRPYPDDKDFNTADVQLIDRPRIRGEPLTIKYVKLNSLQREHGKFQGHPWNARIGDMVYIYWLAEREALVLGTCTSVEQEPVCRSQADDQQQEYVFKLCPCEEPGKNADGNYVIFPNPKHPDCYKWWPKTRDSIWIFDCLEGHNTPSCCAQAPCNGLDDHQSSTCFKNFSDISPTTIDKQWRFKFLHHCGSYWYFDDDAVWRIAGKKSGQELGFIHHYADGKIEVNSPVEVKIKAPSIILDGDVEITKNNKIDGACDHGACSCTGDARVGQSTGTGEQQAIAHGCGAPPDQCSAFCTSPGGSCSVDYADDTFLYIVCTAGVNFTWNAKALSQLNRGGENSAGCCGIPTTNDELIIGGI